MNNPLILLAKTTSPWIPPIEKWSDIQWQPVPDHSDSPGNEGWMAYDNSYFYIYTNGKWIRIPISEF